MLISCFYSFTKEDKNAERPAGKRQTHPILAPKMYVYANPKCIKPNLKDGKGKAMGSIGQIRKKFFFTYQPLDRSNVKGSWHTKSFFYRKKFAGTAKNPSNGAKNGKETGKM